MQGAPSIWVKAGDSNLIYSVEGMRSNLPQCCWDTVRTLKKGDGRWDKHHREMRRLTLSRVVWESKIKPGSLLIVVDRERCTDQFTDGKELLE